MYNHLLEQSTHPHSSYDTWVKAVKQVFNIKEGKIQHSLPIFTNLEVNLYNNFTIKFQGEEHIKLVVKSVHGRFWRAVCSSQ